MDNQSPISSEEVRNWLELPSDILSHIFLKLGAIDILLRAQLVCSVWRKASKEPLLFRSIDMRIFRDYSEHKYDMQKMVREAVDRSCGQLVEFSMDFFGRDELLAHIADMSGELRCLRLVSCYHLSDDALMNMARKAVMLEELEICYCCLSFSKDTLKAVGNACPRLKSFRLNSNWPDRECDDVALAIAENMPQLQHLHLFGNKMTNVGLRAILEGCQHLESLDLRQCFNVNLEGDLQLLKSYRDRLVKLRLPNDSTDDYEFYCGIDYGYDDYEYDYEDWFG